ncbi:RsmB/NOP family class I SAM-dependent RNA methyltransferase [Amphibiibacter pelophylacis]|uniref:RsmB/NOP family class I SAM-dependent RNA methyltransferase n=1 Tax=Amphibiibacter pelophylacis TaxID=1799477 RepID=A0ACC6P4S2_9BURK
MSPKQLLDLAQQLVHDVLTFTYASDTCVSSFFRRNKLLGPRERHALAETTYQVVRQRLLYTHLALDGKKTTPENRAQLERRLVLLGWQGRDVDLHAGSTVDERDWLAKMRKTDLAALPDKLRHNLPDWLAQRLRDQAGDDFWPLVEALHTPAPLDLRVNALRIKREAAIAGLQEDGMVAAPTPYSPWGLRVQGKPALNRNEMFLRGDIEVQDEGSQLLALLVDAHRGEMVADFCAGAGGKTLALGASMRNTGRLYAFDTSGHRLAALKPRLKRSGLDNVYTAQIAHERDERIKRLQGKMDRVLVDAPCSGMGTLRRNPDLKWRQSPAALVELAALQTQILASAARLVKPGGRLVYSTCSLLREENEAIAEAFGSATPGWTRLDAAAVLEKAGVENAADLVRNGDLRLWPHRHACDGFYAAVWQKD